VGTEVQTKDLDRSPGKLHALEGGKRQRAGDYQGSFGERGITAWWRLALPADPPVHVLDHRAPEEADRQRGLRMLGGQRSLSLGWWEAAREMLETGKEIDPHLGRDGGIRRAIWKRVDERGGPSPVFVGSVGLEDLGHHAVGASAIQ